MKKRDAGFTLIELMLVVAIVSLLAAIAIPKFANMIVKAKESSVKAKLGTLRSTFSIYYADNEGINPMSGFGGQSLSNLFVPKYIKAIPAISLPTIPESVHPKSNKTHSDATPSDDTWGEFPEDFAWFAKTMPAVGVLTGLIAVNCTHPDSQGRIWSTW